MKLKWTGTICSLAAMSPTVIRLMVVIPHPTQKEEEGVVLPEVALAGHLAMTMMNLPVEVDQAVAAQEVAVTAEVRQAAPTAAHRAVLQADQVVLEVTMILATLCCQTMLANQT